MNTTINTKFDSSILPSWARHNPAVVWLAKRDLGYRCNVMDADPALPLARRNLIEQAERILNS